MSPQAAPFGNIDHVAIVVANMKKSIHFYRKYFGFEVERSFGNKDLGVKATVLKRKTSRIELFEYSAAKPSYAKRIREIHGVKVSPEYFEPGLRHIAFRTNTFNNAVKDLQKRGLKARIKPKKGYSGDSITFFQDPNGILLEIVSPLGRKKKAPRK